jgi:hypothetical protein
MSYHVDRFFAAVSVLAGHGHIKQRLIHAFADHLLEISDDELPLSVQQGFLDLKRLVSRVAPLNGEGAVCASVRKMSVEEASECAAQVVALYAEIAHLGGEMHAAISRERGERAGVPPFLVKSS